jgi:hypothetical protein
MTEVATPKSKYWNEDKKKFIIQTQLKDEQGNSVGPLQYFEADTLEELLEKKDAAHQNAAVKLYETRKAVKLGALIEPDRDEPIQTFEERPLSADERVKLEKMLKDPATAPEAISILIEAKLGGSLESVRQVLRQQEIDKRVGRIQESIDVFKAGHPEYVESAENKNELLKYLEKRELPLTRKNLEIAFSDLCDEGKILLRKLKAEEPPVVAPAAPAQAPPSQPEIPVATTKEPEIPAAPTEVRPKQSSSGLGRDNSTATPGATPLKTQGITIRDINRMSAKEYQEALRDPEFRKQVDALYAKK